MDDRTQTSYQPAEVIRACAGRSTDALRFLTAFYRLVHGLDDVADAAADQKPAVEAERWITPLREFILETLLNPFCREHNREIATLVANSVAGWLDSNRIDAKDTERAKAVADVLKSQYHEVFWFVAWKANDWHYMRKCQEAFREWDWD